MGCSLLGQGPLQAALPDAPWQELVASFGYTLGFIFVTMARQQLFTETTLTVMLPVLHRTHGISDVVRYWSIVFAANIVGTILFAVFLGYLFVRLGAARAAGRSLQALRDPLAARVRPLAWGLTVAFLRRDAGADGG